jgi:DNA-binding transcriptional LysR family regulator
MDTRQLATFCAVVERKSFSQAAERLGVTQPAVSLQIRALEKRLGRQLFDRSGRRVEPTEAGLRLYRGAQRLLALEEQLVEEVTGDEETEISGRLELGSSSGPGGAILPLLLCEFQAAHPSVTVALTVLDTSAVVELVASRELELGIVGAARRHRSVTFEPFFRDEVVLACRPDHRFANRTIALDELRSEPLIVMQEGAGVRQMIDDGAMMLDGVTTARAMRAYAGVRPLYDLGAEAEGREMSRNFAVIDHEQRDGVKGFTSIVGGKVTTYRLMAERVVDLVARRLGVTAACTTASNHCCANVKWSGPRM